MSKMNWEHRNKMQKVWENPASKPAKKRKGLRGNTRTQKYLQRHLGHVRLESKYKSNCALCPKLISVGNLIWWNPEDKYVVHDECFGRYLK